MCRGHHGDVCFLMTPVSFKRKGAAQVPSGHIITPSPSSHLSYCLLLLSSFAPTQPPRLFRLPLPVSYYVLLRKCASAGEKLHQCRAGFKAGVGGGGVHYAWPPTWLQGSMAQVHMQLKHGDHICVYRLTRSGAQRSYNTVIHKPACLDSVDAHTST